MANPKVVIDAGHGGQDSGAIYNGRNEKDDNLKLALAVGKILENNGVNVVYTRTTDTYDTPFKKATIANESGADYFVSIHRNSSETPNQNSGIQTLVYKDTGIRSQMARNINSELSDLGFENLGVDVRPNLVVLKRTKMPAVLVEAGFINNASDNEMFDRNFEKIANGIADGILKTINPVNALAKVNEIEASKTDSSIEILDKANNVCECLYRVQVGAYRNKDNADRMLNSLLAEGFPAFVIYEDGLYKVQVGAFRFLNNAVKMEQKLRRFRYNTYIVYS